MSAKKEVTMADVHSTVKAAISVIANEFGPRIKALESRNDLTYRGVWQEQQYPQNSAVTHSGSIWIARQATSDKPPSAHWTLAVKGAAQR